MRIILDGRGGENIEEESPSAVARFLKEDTVIQLAVATTRIHFESLQSALDPVCRPRLSWLEAPEKINFDENPVAAFRTKKMSSIRIALESLKDPEKEALVSFGHTGAAVAGAHLYIGLLPGVERAGLGAIVPNRHGVGLLMDVGANLYCKPNHLLQYAQMADLYCSQVLGIDKPRVGLLNIGEEEGKGDHILQEAHALFKKGSFRFVGNVEGGQIFDGSVDAIITNGLTGNIVLKSAESLANVLFETLGSLLKNEQMDELLQGKTRWLISSLASRHNPDSRGACRLLGVRGLVLIGHGNARAASIYSALVTARRELQIGLQAAIGRRLASK